jgi:hypothetical protein
MGTHWQMRSQRPEPSESDTAPAVWQVGFYAVLAGCRPSALLNVSEVASMRVGLHAPPIGGGVHVLMQLMLAVLLVLPFCAGAALRMPHATWP